MVLNRRYTLFAAAVVIAVVAGGAIYWHQTALYHFATVESGVLYRSGLLETHQLERVLDSYGIRTVVSLIDVRSHREQVARQARILRERGLSFEEIPMEPETPPSPEQLERWLSLLDDPERLPILVHCKHGVVRTGMMVAVYQLEAGATDNEAVLQDLPMFGHDLDRPHRAPMREFIRGYRSTGGLGGPPG
jgi:protein tyrosine/serine phosphatase